MKITKVAVQRSPQRVEFKQLKQGHTYRAARHSLDAARVFLAVEGGRVVGLDTGSVYSEEDLFSSDFVEVNAEVTVTGDAP